MHFICAAMRTGPLAIESRFKYIRQAVTQPCLKAIISAHIDTKQPVHFKNAIDLYRMKEL